MTKPLQYKIWLTGLIIAGLLGTTACVEEPAEAPKEELETVTEALHPPATFKVHLDPWQIYCMRASEQGSWFHPDGDEIIALYSLQHLRNGAVVNTQFGITGPHYLRDGSSVRLDSARELSLQMQEGDRLIMNITLIDEDDDSDAREAYDTINQVAGLVGQGISAAFPPAAPAIEIIDTALDLFGYAWDFFDWLDENDNLGSVTVDFVPRYTPGVQQNVSTEYFIHRERGEFYPDWYYQFRYYLTITELPWTQTNKSQSRLAAWTSQPGARVIPGDFNRDGFTDFAITGVRGWSSVPVAFSNGDGSFRYTNVYRPEIARWASDPNVRVVAGDFNDDGLDDLLLTGGSGWQSVPVAFSDGAGGFRVDNLYDGYLSGLTPDALVRAGDFNGDDCTDLAVVGPRGNYIATSNCAGQFLTQSAVLPYFSQWRSHPGAELVVANFNGDRYDDLAFVGGTGWNSIPVAFSLGNGRFSLSNRGVADFPRWATYGGVQIATGHFDDDECEDLTLTGGSGWTTIPVALSNCDGTFTISNDRAPADFTGWASRSGVTAFAGDFDNDGYGDVALTGVPGWQSIPIAFRD